MLPAANAGVGNAIATPDVCMTPDGTGGSQAIPYTNTATNAQATGASQVVKISMVAALNTGSSIPSSSGDEAGTNSSTMGKTTFTTGDSIVSIDGMPAVELTTPTSQNGVNAVGSVLVPSLVNVFFNLAPDADARGSGGDRYRHTLDAARARALHQALHGGVALRAELLAGGVGHLVVSLFTPSVADEAHAAIRRLSPAGLRALILDVRGCPGGDLEGAVALAGAFLPPGSVVARVTLEGETVVHEARGGLPHTHAMVVLVDGATASAGELFAGALQAHDRALVVGHTTFGKGAVQALVAAGDGVGVVMATVGRCSLPNGDPIEGVGIHPDFEPSTKDEAGRALAAAWALAAGMAS